MLMSEPVRDKYKWVLLVFPFVAFFLELGSRQLYNAVLPQWCAFKLKEIIGKMEVAP